MPGIKHAHKGFMKQNIANGLIRNKEHATKQGGLSMAGDEVEAQGDNAAHNEQQTSTGGLLMVGK